jgi:acetate kinase
MQNLTAKYQQHKLISDQNSSCKIYCVRTDEEIMIAQDVIKLLNLN